MASQYVRLPVPATEELSQSSDTQNNNGYELGSVRYQGPERYEPFTSQPTAPYVNPHLAEDYSYASYQSDVPVSRSPVSSITRKVPQTATTSVNSLTSQHLHAATSPGVVDTRRAIRTTMISWGFELLAVTVSLGALLAIILVLRKKEGRPLTAWTLAITLNTVIATLGTLARTTLAFALSACVGQQKWNWLRIKSDQLVAWERFDEASRGPWGATRLFIWLRARHWTALGALVIVGSVAFDPFLQAVLTTYGQLDEDPRTAAQAQIPQALVVDAGIVLELPTFGMRFVETSAGNLTILGGTVVQPDFGMMSAIYNGFRNDTTWYQDEEVVSSVCTTGNCTWTPFTSAAVCSACNSVSDRVSVNRGFGEDGGTIPTPSNQRVSGPYTKFELAIGSLSNFDYASYSTPQGGRRQGLEATLLTANATFDAHETQTFKDLETMLVSFIVMKASEEWIQGKVAWNVSKPTATECALYLCANKYQARVQNGKLTETVLGSWAVRDKASYTASQNSSNFKPGPAADAFVASKGDKLYDSLMKRTDLRVSIPAEEIDETNPRTYNISYAFITTISSFLQDFTAVTEDINQMAFPMWNTGMTPLVNVFWDSQNLTETFDHVARSLTNQVRKTVTNASNIKQIPGTTQKWEIHVRVRWAYLAFPATMIALGIIYVLLTIVESTRLEMPVWKESALPSLLHGLNDDTQHLLRDLNSQQIGLKANETVVRFGYDQKDDCLRLVADRATVH